MPTQDSLCRTDGEDAAAALAARERLLEHQLRHHYREIAQLRKERYEIVYTASWLVVRPLLWAEERLAAFARRLSAPAPAFASDRPSPAAPAEPARAPGLGRLLVDVTGTAARDMGTGIERVTKELSRALAEAAPAQTLLVLCDRGRLFECRAPFGAGGGRAEAPLKIEPGDCLLIVADSWNYREDYRGVPEALRAGGGRTVVCLHDLIPELYPAACHERTVTLFRPWLREMLLTADGVLAVSQATAAELMAAIRDRSLAHRPGLPVGWFHNASCFEPRPGAAARPEIGAAVAGGEPAFLCVGTLEPRKGHFVALEALERLWAQGRRMRLVIVGARGWFDYALVDRIRRHEEYGRRLFWFDDVCDEELAFLYARAAALICPSFAEGFGLPVIEASRCGLPVFASDIPIFRETGRDGAIYFRVNDPDALAEAIAGWAAGARVAHPGRVLDTSWSDAARRILDALERDAWTCRLD